MLEENVKDTYKSINAKIGDILKPEDKKDLKTFAQKIHSMDANDVGRLHNGTADKLTSEQKDIVAYEVKLREYELYKKLGIDPKVAFLPENLRKKRELSEDKISEKYILDERALESDMSEDLLERSKNIIENAYIPVDASKFHSMDGGGINALYNKVVAIDDNGNKVKVNNRAIQEKFRKNYLKALSDVTGIDYTRIDDEFYDNFEPMTPPGAPEPTAFQAGDKVIYDRPNTVDELDFSDYEDDD